ncbi:hypothetical protein MG293_007848 [Ovis ammon polii]|uniref:Growth arrest and DNA damage-inducible protein GADD45 gamma n=2 Tax=Boreoeutheria TaxID=1437010 RepID=A0AAD4YC41_OVIAM|nr:hypothetical protein MG293_007848 [Ovis ammon polii]
MTMGFVLLGMIKQRIVCFLSSCHEVFGETEFPGVLFLSLVNDSQYMGGGFMNNSDFGEFGSHAACRFSHVPLGQLHLQLLLLFQQLLLLLAVKFSALILAMLYSLPLLPSQRERRDRNMTLEEVRGQDTVPESTARMQGAGKALHELLLSAQRQGCLTAGVYESAKVLNVDPDNVTFCVLAADEEDEGDIALQIHFTLIQAFCCENDIDIVRVGDVQRLAAIVGTGDESGAPGDLHCILISNPNEDAWKDPALEKLSLFCEESRSVNDWVPNITLPE